MKNRELRDRLLVALVEHAEATSLSDYLSPKEVADSVGLVRRPGQLRMIVDGLEDDGLVRTSKTMGGGDEGGLDLMLRSRALDEVDDIREAHPEYKVRVPGSDRYVRVDHNEREAIETDLLHLRTAITSSNEGSEEDRLVSLGEIAVFESAIVQPRISAELIERFVERILRWIVTVFSKAMVTEVAEPLARRLLALVRAGL